MSIPSNVLSLLMNRTFVLLLIGSISEGLPTHIHHRAFRTEASPPAAARITIVNLV
jgi:hypothetical protein